MGHSTGRASRSKPRFSARLSAAVLVATSGAAYGQLNQPFPPVFELSSLLPDQGGDGSIGFVAPGIAEWDGSGRCVAPAGDVNGDGLADIIIGAPGADDANGGYVVFGRVAPFPALFDLSDLDGSNGFRLGGGDGSGVSVASAGDVNGDGVDDLIIGAPSAGQEDYDCYYGSYGATYVVFGRTTPFPASIDLSGLDGATGFRLDGIQECGYTESGISVAGAGDVNGDGIDDIIIGGGHYYMWHPRRAVNHVVFGRATPFPPSIDLATLDGSDGFLVDGPYMWYGPTTVVASAGDVNGDGFDDVIVSGWDFFGSSSAVIFGRAGAFPAVLKVYDLDGTDGFRMPHAEVYDDCGYAAASAGDINGDGLDDLIIGAPWDYAGYDGYLGGQSYVVFGRTSPFPASLDLKTLDGVTGFRLSGVIDDDWSGSSVAPAGDVNGDGLDDLIVGARYGDPGGRSRAGKSYVVFGRTTPFPAAFDLPDLDGQSGFRLDGIDKDDQVGHSVASAGDINGDGVDDLIIGARFADPGGRLSAGESYIVFGRSPPPDVCESGELFAPGGHPADSFGESVALSADTMIVGAFRDDTAGQDAGAATVLAEDNGDWLPAAKLLAADAQPGDFFGVAVSASGTAAIVGAPRADPAGANSGAAYIFRRLDGGWTQEAKLAPPDAVAGDQFGFSVALQGNTALVGAWRANLPGAKDAGAAYIFARENAVWVLKAKLTANDAAVDDQFGTSVALSDSFAHVGAPGDNNANGADAGASYVYRPEGGQWPQSAKLLAPGGKAGDQFGSALAADGPRALIGSVGSDAAAPDAGAAWFYLYDGQDWSVETAATLAGAQPGDGAGQSVALSGGVALVGAWTSDLQGTDSGAVALFERAGKSWSESANLTGHSIQAGDLLGTSVAIGPGTLAAGAIHADGPGGLDQGAVLVYSMNGCPCYPDFTGDANLDLFDFLEYVNAFNTGEDRADCTLDGALDFFDFLCFTNAFSAGC